jgi:hypothetical protein
MKKCKCGSYAINESLGGRIPEIFPDLCDVCYWKQLYINLLEEITAIYEKENDYQHGEINTKIV